MVREFFVRPIRDVIACLEQVAESPTPRRSLLVMLVSLIAAWFVYVPIHELLHVAGCVVTGGAISQLEIAPQYGGTLLARMFPFVVSGGEYAGRLSGFDVKGSDLIYLATDFMPFALSVVLGVPLIQFCARRRSAVLFGVSCVLGLAPFYNIFGDYYEMGSILVTRGLAEAADQTVEFPAIESPTVKETGDAVEPVAGQVVHGVKSRNDPASSGIVWSRLRGDDVFKRIASVYSDSSEFGIKSSFDILVSTCVVLISFGVGIILAFATYSLGGLFVALLGPSVSIRQAR